MAAPFVSGVAALLLSVNPTLRPSDVYDILRATCDDIWLPGRDDHTGYGRLNAFRAVSRAVNYVSRVVAKAYSYPNPLRQRADDKQEAYFYIPEALGDDNLKVRIYNFSGDVIRTVKGNIWNGKDENGNFVPTGLYFFAVETSRGKSTGKMTVIR